MGRNVSNRHSNLGSFKKYVGDFLKKNFTTAASTSSVNSRDKHNLSPLNLSRQQSLKNENEPNETDDVALNQEQSAIYKLPIELLTDIFDYLPIDDLCEVRRTSKWFHEVAGFCFQKNYSAFCRSIRHQRNRNLDAFLPLIQRLQIEGIWFTYFNEYEYISKRWSRFQHLKIMELDRIDFRDLKIEHRKELLDKIEYLKITNSKSSKIFIKNIFILFPNLKRLSIRGMGWMWIACKCPKLEDFRFNSYYEAEEITSFLGMNPNIRKLAINSRCLWNSRESMKSAKISLEDLAIDFDNDRTLGSIFQLLIELHALGVYKRLKLYSNFLHIEDKFVEINSLHALIKLHFYGNVSEVTYGYRLTKCFALSTFQNLEEISLFASYNLNDIESMADNLKNLERIRFEQADLNDLITFIKRARKLTKIRVNKFICFPSNMYISYIDRKDRLDKEPNEQTVINLSFLNKERAKLPKANTVTLYVWA